MTNTSAEKEAESIIRMELYIHLNRFYSENNLTISSIKRKQYEDKITNQILNEFKKSNLIIYQTEELSLCDKGHDSKDPGFWKDSEPI